MEYYDKNPTGEISPPEPEKTTTDIEVLAALDAVTKNTAIERAKEPVAEQQDKSPVIEEQGKTIFAAPDKPNTEKPDKPRNKKKRGVLIAVIAVVSVLVLLVGGAVLIAQPWIPAPDGSYVAPDPVRVSEPMEIRVGEMREIVLPLGPNERISFVSTPDSDVLAITESSILGLGEWDGIIVTVQVMGTEPVQAEDEPFKVLGMDLTNLRSRLRLLFGIDEPKEEEQDPRVVAIYEIVVNITGHDTKEILTPINIYTEDMFHIVLPDLLEGQEVVFEYDDTLLLIEPSATDWGTFVVTSGEVPGTGSITATVGFYKDGTFVTVRAFTYTFEILPRPEEGEPPTFTQGEYNGLVPVKVPEEQAA